MDMDSISMLYLNFAWGNCAGLNKGAVFFAIIRYYPRYHQRVNGVVCQVWATNRELVIGFKQEYYIDYIDMTTCWSKIGPFTLLQGTPPYFSCGMLVR
jgi:hypothetical protein